MIQRKFIKCEILNSNLLQLKWINLFFKESVVSVWICISLYVKHSYKEEEIIDCERETAFL